MGHRDRGRNPVDAFRQRFLQACQELARVCRETLDVSTLPFRVERIQCQAGLAAAADAAKNRQLPSRHIEIDISQVIDCDSSQSDIAVRQGPLPGNFRSMNPV